MSDYFTVFELPRKLTVDGEALQRRFYELSRQHHPDFHQGADAARQAEALTQSALVNRAYRALRDPLARVEYLIALEEGREVREGATDKPKAPRELLQEMLEVQETIEEAKAEGLGGEAAERLRGERRRLEERYAAEAEAIVARSGEWDRLVDEGGDRKALLEWFKQRLATRAYFRTVIDDLSDALGESEESHVPHRRH
ncbi:MAG TPA: Fe-S protein assembly co-chaperone HscB [Methylomirabilota bacterium]|jgi:molecular chaperone HscB|nr:Fe-S protein assembly co-chaperone HscB [Methylomirabilota bacterium]